jgi:hypothetical protein
LGRGAGLLVFPRLGDLAVTVGVFALWWGFTVAMALLLLALDSRWSLGQALVIVALVLSVLVIGAGVYLDWGTL